MKSCDTTCTKRQKNNIINPMSIFITEANDIRDGITLKQDLDFFQKRGVINGGTHLQTDT